jgi:L-idonate 5-dehydrogenase
LLNMKTCTIHGPKSLEIEDRPVPRPDTNELVIRLGAGGICGSDLHYYHEGGVGDFRLKKPFILGHEVAGEVAEVGSGVESLKLGQRVAVNPTRACLRCPECLSGRSNLCRDVYFYGSAARVPHVDGGFAEYFIATERQCMAIPEMMDFRVAACAEPLAVTGHAAFRAGSLVGKRVLITGAGPIGVLLAATCRFSGATEVVITDLLDEPLETAKKMGATETVNVSHVENTVTKESRKSAFDVAFEASGNLKALESCILVTRVGGKVVQVGSLPPGSSPAPLSKIIAKEIDLLGSFRFADEYRWAVDVLSRGWINVAPMLTKTFPLSDAVEAFELASDRRRAMKVSLVSG